MESVFTQTYDIKDNMVDCQGYLKPSQILFIAPDMGSRVIWTRCRETAQKSPLAAMSS